MWPSGWPSPDCLSTRRLLRRGRTGRSAKLITSFFRSGQVKEQVNELLKNRDGLMLGVCNGFQALIKLGLVPYGEIVDTDETVPP